MKRTLSLILALSMIMSLFTTVSFAAADESAAKGKINSVTVTKSDVKYPVGYSSSSSTATIYYLSSAPTGLAKSNFTVNVDNGYTFDSYSDDTLYVKKTSDSSMYYASVASEKIEVKLVSDHDSLRVDQDAKKVYYTGSELSASKLTERLTESLVKVSDGKAVSLGETITLSKDGANIKATVKKSNTTYFGGAFDTGYDLVVETGLTYEITNGSKAEYTNSALVKAIEKLRDVDIASGAEVVLTLPADYDGHFKFYKDKVDEDNEVDGTEFNLVDDGDLVVKPEAGYIEDVVVDYEVGDYSGEIVFKSVYAAGKEVTQHAPFSREWFYMDSISGVDKVKAEDATTPSGRDTYTDTKIDPSTKDESWEVKYTAYAKTTPVASPLTVTFVPKASDLTVQAVDGEKLFDSDAFEKFAAAVVKEQVDDKIYSGYLDEVQIDDAKVSGKYTLYNGSKAMSNGDEISPTKLDAVTIDIAKSGIYYIDFTATYKYRETKGGSEQTLNADGRVMVYAGNKGDIVYEVIAGDAVTFDTADFQSAYKKLTSNSKSLTSVTVDALPSLGTLYSDTTRTTAVYKVSAGDAFYVKPTNDQDDLDKLTYRASSTYTEEYSVFVPVTMNGTGGDETVVVEIKVNGDMPFTDIAKNHVFYDYIRYCYNNKIMGGKTSTKFDATSSISRIQLVVTLYRMAGSPTTYNYTTLEYTDTKNLNAEFTSALKWATAKNIVGGYGNQFKPNSAVTRQAMVTILYRYAKTTGYEIGVLYDNHLGAFTDGGKVSTAMKDAMNWAVDYGIVSGNGNKLNPSGSTTRGAAAKILANFHKLYIG